MRFQVQLVMFDLDGTLIDTAPQIAQAANQMLAALGLPQRPTAEIATYIGEGVQHLIKRCLTGGLHLEPDSALFAQAQPLYQQAYAANATQSLPYAQARATLQALQTQGFLLACVTNKPQAFTMPLLEAAGLAHFFSLVVSGDQLAKKKPDPLPLLHVCHTLNVLPAQAMMVGDSDTDIAAASAAGCFVVTVPYGYNQGRPLALDRVDAQIAQLDELMALLALPARLMQEYS